MKAAKVVLLPLVFSVAAPGKTLQIPASFPGMECPEPDLLAKDLCLHMQCSCLMVHLRGTLQV